MEINTVLDAVSGVTMRCALEESIVTPLEIKDLAMMIIDTIATSAPIHTQGILEDWDRDREYSFHIVLGVVGN